jgi:hypothetical protein
MASQHENKINRSIFFQGVDMKGTKDSSKLFYYMENIGGFFPYYKFMAIMEDC